jgi:ribosomal-protein-alanine N-acetyltransferase
MKIFIQTKRLILRELLSTDVDGMFSLNSDPEVHRYLGTSPVTTKVHSQKDIEFIQRQYVANGIGRWAVIERSTNIFLGWAGLKLITTQTNNHIDYYDLGYRLINKYWGQGYATESAQAIVNYGFKTLNLREIYGIADVLNTGSIRVLEKVGLKKLETFDYMGNPHHWMRIENKDYRFNIKF